jgi:hypothetical protein
MLFLGRGAEELLSIYNLLKFPDFDINAIKKHFHFTIKLISLMISEGLIRVSSI